MQPPFISLLLCLGLLAPLAADDKPIIDTSKSPKAILHGVPVSAVKLGDGFWTERRRVNEEVSLPTMFELLEQNGILDNFRRAAGTKDVPRRGPVYTDSDIYKWLEADAFVLQNHDNPKLRALGEGAIDTIVAAQQPDGYLNTLYVKENASKRHTRMADNHELYCLGHMLQAAVAWKRATGETKLLDSGLKMVAYLLANFGPDKKPLMEGHPEVEMALIECYREVGDKRYLELAHYLLESDPRIKLDKWSIVYHNTGRPFWERTILEGHAVRAMYACSGATDYYLETGDRRYMDALDRLWQDLTQRKMYITGGVGSRESGEAFGEPYELPNQLAYTESCAAIGEMFWQWRMLQATAEAKYMDVFERALYNGVNSGLSLKGNLYCYRNPLELIGDPEDRIRNPWYDTTCCPPNIQRVLASLPGYMYSTSTDALYVHLYHAGTLAWHLEDGTPLEVRQETNYPWSGAVTVRVNPAAEKRFTLNLRIPAWASGATLAVNGTAQPAPRPAAYAAIQRSWKRGDVVKLTLPIAPRLTAANPLVRDDVGKLAVEYGPLVYCMEGLDQPAPENVFAWTLDLRVPGAASPAAFQAQWEKDLLGGVVTLTHQAVHSPAELAREPLYAPFTAGPLNQPAGVVKLIPYYTFDNREPTTMQVWVPYTR
jgi:hypothetical protein